MAKGKKKTAAADAPSEDRVLLRVASSDKPGGKDDVFVSVNGVAYLIKRDVEVEVPRGVVAALQDASIIDYSSGKAVRVPRWAFNVKEIEKPKAENKAEGEEGDSNEF